MAGEWIKWVKGLAKKREVIVLASKLRRERHEIAGRLMDLWEWCDENIPDDAFDEEGNASLCIGDNPLEFLDTLLGLPGFAEAMTSPEVRWLAARSEGHITFPNLGRHNGSTAKTRALEAKKKARQRAAAKKSVPEDVPKRPGLEREENERRVPIVKSDGVTNGDSASNGQPPPSSPGSPLKSSGRRKTLRLPDDFAWDHVVAMAEKVARWIPPLSEKDRRAWFRYAGLAEYCYGENWLIDAVEAVKSTPSRETPQKHFVGTLIRKAHEIEKISAEAFNALARSIKVPDGVWKLPILGGPNIGDS